MRRILVALSLPAIAASAQAPPDRAAPPAGRDGIRQSSIATCIAAARDAAPRVIAEFDWSELCGCATDRVMAGRSDSQLRRMTAADAARRDAVQACLAELRSDRPESVKTAPER